MPSPLTLFGELRPVALVPTALVVKLACPRTTFADWPFRGDRRVPEQDAVCSGNPRPLPCFPAPYTAIGELSPPARPRSRRRSALRDQRRLTEHAIGRPLLVLGIGFQISTR